MNVAWEWSNESEKNNWVNYASADSIDSQTGWYALVNILLDGQDGPAVVVWKRYGRVDRTNAVPRLLGDFSAFD